MQSAELTLIVAATRNMGIGLHGSLPWKGLRREMQYFARVTTRLPPSASASPQYHNHNHQQQPQPQQTPINAVIMGRKTWDSIPPRFRPLKDRLNIIVSRSQGSGESPLPGSSSSPSAAAITTTTTPSSSNGVWLSSLDRAVEYTQNQSACRVFVMGGAQVYEAALKLPQVKRVLLTSIQTDFECDTFFPLDLTGAVEGGGGGVEGGWRRGSREELESWTGEEVDEGGQEEAGTRYEFQMWERME